MRGVAIDYDLYSELTYKDSRGRSVTQRRSIEEYETIGLTNWKSMNIWKKIGNSFLRLSQSQVRILLNKVEIARRKNITENDLRRETIVEIPLLNIKVKLSPRGAY